MLDKHCAFVTFSDWRHAGDAMQELQAKDVLGQKILIKYPDRALLPPGKRPRCQAELLGLN